MSMQEIAVILIRCVSQLLYSNIECGKGQPTVQKVAFNGHNLSHMFLLNRSNAPCPARIRGIFYFQYLLSIQEIFVSVTLHYSCIMLISLQGVYYGKKAYRRRDNT